MEEWPKCAMGPDDAKFAGLHLADFEVVQHRIGHGKLAFFGGVNHCWEVYADDFEGPTQEGWLEMNYKIRGQINLENIFGNAWPSWN